MKTKTVRIRGIENVREIYALFKSKRVKHWPIRFVQVPDIYEITLRESDPMLGFIVLKYSQ